MFVPSDKGQRLNRAGEKYCGECGAVKIEMNIYRTVKQRIHTAEHTRKSADTGLKHADYQRNIERKYLQKILFVMHGRYGYEHSRAAHKSNNEYILTLNPLIN